MWAAPLTDFYEDKLNLESFADDLTNIVMSPLPHPTNEYSKVIALDSGWGTGKTSFINMWTKKLNTDSKFICLTYNAWENDDSSNALIPILCNFQQMIAQKPNVKYLLRKCLNHVSLSISPLPCVTLNINSKTKTQLSDMILAGFSAQQERKQSLEKLINAIRGEDKYLIICIDELDRCRPTFAIETLEVVKHFFDLPHVVFVFSLDMSQLHKSIETVYGGIDSLGYLQRFFDYRISLPKQELENFLKDRLEELDPLHTELCKCEIIWLGKIARDYSIPLRTLNKICVVYNCFKTYTRSNFDWTKRNFSWVHCKDTEPHIENDKDGQWYYFRTYLTLIAMKYFCPAEYWSFIQKGTNFDNLRKNKDDALLYETFGEGNMRQMTDKTVKFLSCYTKDTVRLTPNDILRSYSKTFPGQFTPVSKDEEILYQTRYRLLVGSEIDMDEYRDLLLPDFIDRIIEDDLLESKHPRAN